VVAAGWLAAAVGADATAPAAGAADAAAADPAVREAAPWDEDVLTTEAVPEPEVLELAGEVPGVGAPAAGWVADVAPACSALICCSVDEMDE